MSPKDPGGHRGYSTGDAGKFTILHNRKASRGHHRRQRSHNRTYKANAATTNTHYQRQTTR